MPRLPFLRGACWLWILAVVSLSSGRADAYAWMIKHGFSKCGSCHTDPAGGETLTPFGRFQSQHLLSMGGAELEEQSKRSRFLFGAIDEPTDLSLGGSYRHMLLYSAGVPGVPAEWRQFPMQLDVYGSGRIGQFVIGMSLGVAKGIEGNANVRAAELNKEPGDGFIVLSRSHYLGLWLQDDTLLRVGRLNLPFGVRIPEHTLWARESTRTDRESDQQHGASLTYTGGRWRVDAMLVLGNFQLNPDKYRERGYVTTIEYLLTPTLAVGASSLLTHSQVDSLTRVKNSIRYANGALLRWGATRKLSLLAELDMLKEGGRNIGTTGFLQTDYEAWQGVHLLLTGEVLDQGLLENSDVLPQRGAGAPRYGAWIGIDWFPIEHLELRVDGVMHQDDVFQGQAQLHLYL
ncbi:MAG: hypothetical protein ABI895_03865 [Deltaproteobacteria bacterium]